MTTIELLAQLIGIIAFILSILSFQVKSNHKLYFMQLLASVALVTQFFLLGALSGAVSSIFPIFRNILLMNINKWKWVGKKSTLCIFLAIIIGFNVMIWDGWLSLLPLTAVVMVTIFSWQNNARMIRIGELFFANPLWIVYDIYFHSYGAMLTEMSMMVSIIISIIRFGWKAMGDPDSEFSK